MTACHETGNGKPVCIREEDLTVLHDATKRLEQHDRERDGHLGAIMAEASGAHRDAHETRRVLERIEPALSRLVLLVGEPVPPTGLYRIVLQNANNTLASGGAVPTIRQSIHDDVDEEVTKVNRSYLHELQALEGMRVKKWQVILAGVAAIVVPVVSAITAYLAAKGDL